MRRKILITVGSIIVVLAGLFLADWWLRTHEPPLRKGMTEDEVTELLGKADSTIGNERMRTDAYPQGPDVFGNRKMILINITADGRVASWFIETLPRGRPWWLGGSKPR
jgi:hypothetical protein